MRPAPVLRVFGPDEANASPTREKQMISTTMDPGALPSATLVERGDDAIDTIRTFATPTRMHVGIEVRDLEASIRFYEALFGAPPVKRKPRYAKFESEHTPVNLSLNEHAGAVARMTGGAAHLGIEVKSKKAVAAAMARMSEAGVGALPETGNCCFAFQEKIWLSDPDGNQWEIFVVLSDEEDHGADAASMTGGASEKKAKGGCCG